VSIARTDFGLEAQFRNTGFFRFFSAGFLGVWLAGWAIGEVVVTCILCFGAWALLTDQPPGANREPLAPEFAIPMGLFLLFWLSFWTLGGFLAGREFLRLLFGCDRITATVDGLTITHSYGIFRSRDNLSRNEIRRIYRQPRNAALCAETTRGIVELTRLGTVTERAELEQKLNAAYELSTAPRSEGALPPDWCEITNPERETVLIKNPDTRRKQARVAWMICMVISSVALYLIAAADKQPSLWGLAAILALASMLIGWGAIWLSLGRKEWLPEKGRLILQKRFGQNRTRKFEGAALEVIEDNSGDDGPSYHLIAVAPGAGPRPQSHSIGKSRHVIYSATNDPTEPRNFGIWLSRRCSIQLTDETTAEAKAKQFEEIKQKLSASGRFGRAALWLIDRIGAKPDANA